MARYLKEEIICQTEKEFNKKIGADPAIAVFTATWSKACRNDKMIDYLEGLPGKFDGAKFVYADVYQLESVAQNLGLTKKKKEEDPLPAVIFYKKGKPKEPYYFSLQNKNELEKKIINHIQEDENKGEDKQARTSVRKIQPITAADNNV